MNALTILFIGYVLGASAMLLALLAVMTVKNARPKRSEEWRIR